MMQQTKVSLTPPLVEFLNRHTLYGFKDKSSMVRVALQRLQAELELQSLTHSADLYAEIYAHDPDLQELTDVSIDGGR